MAKRHAAANSDLIDEMMESTADLEDKLETLLDDEEDDGCEQCSCNAHPGAKCATCECDLTPGAGHETDPPITEREASGLTEPVVLGQLLELPLADVCPDPDQPRTEVDDELAESIAANGVLEPITVRATLRDDQSTLYMIVNGERRYRGSLKAGRATIPARLVDDEDAGDRLLHQVVFNDGKRLAPMEEAKAWKRIMDAKHWGIAQLATALGKPKTTVSDRIAMLEAPAPFQPLFVSGVLTAAAAPILRPLAELPDAVVQKFYDNASDDWNWRQAEQTGQPLSLQAVKSSIERCLNYPFAAIPKAHEDYPGDTFKFRKQLYAVDRVAFFKFAGEKEAAQAKAAGAKAPKRERDWQAKQAATDRARRAKAEKSRKLRGAQYKAIVAKLPPTLDDRWMSLLLEFAVAEMHQLDQSIACKAVGIELPAGRARHFEYRAQKAILAHAAKLSGPNAKLKLLLQLLLATDLQVSEWSAGTAARLVAAAKLARVDLKKIKPPTDEKPAAAVKPAARAKAATKKPTKAKPSKKARR